jgi:hypothetical protein
MADRTSAQKQRESPESATQTLSLPVVPFRKLCQRAMKPPDPGERVVLPPCHHASRWEAHWAWRLSRTRLVPQRLIDSPVGHKILRPPTSSSPSSLRAPIQTPDTLSDPFGSIRTRHLPANAGHNHAIHHIAMLDDLGISGAACRSDRAQPPSHPSFTDNELSALNSIPQNPQSFQRNFNRNRPRKRNSLRQKKLPTKIFSWRLRLGTSGRAGGLPRLLSGSSAGR